MKNIISDSRVEASKILCRAQKNSIRARAQASERARASEQAGGWAHEQQAGEGYERFASKQEIIWPQSSWATGGTSRWSPSRPRIDDDLYSFTDRGEPFGLCPTNIKLRFVIVEWNSIWCGEKCILLSWISLSSHIKKPQESWYPNKSGVPNDDQDSSLVHLISGVFFFKSFQRSDSFFIVHTPL